MNAPTRQAVDPGVSHLVVEAVAQTEGVSPLELPPLYGCIDPEALDRLFERPSAAGRSEVEVEFGYEGYQVTVSDHGAVSIEALGTERSREE